jgi:pimeloyl-ACP methyl ester carboxylesterase
MLRAALIALALSTAVLQLNASAQSTATPPTTAPATPLVYVRPEPPGQLVDIGGRRLHILCKGEATSGPSVIFEAGTSQFTATGTYGRAQDLIAPFARVCVYDRAGLGWSDPDTQPRTHQRMVRDLHRLLREADVPGPYVLVGHSMGGLTARLYAKTYRRDVVGMVLADSSSEAINFTPQAAQERAATLTQIDQGLATSQPNTPMLPLPAGTPMEVGLAFTPEVIRAMREEFVAIDRAAAHPEAYGTLRSIPLVVVRRGKAVFDEAAETRWRLAQEHLRTLSTNNMMVVAMDAGHVIPYDDPQVIADAVRRVLEAARTGEQVK